MTTDQPLLAAVWCAVSDPQQAKEGKESLPSQERDGLAASAELGATVVAVLKVSGFSRRYIRIDDCAREMAAKGQLAMRQLDEMMRAKAFNVLIMRRGDRFGRSQSLFSTVVETVVLEMNGRLFETSRRRWIDESNFRDYIATEGYRAAAEIDNNVERTRMGMIGRIEKGLAANQVPASHRQIRDPRTGEALRLEVREELRALWDDMATLLLERPKVAFMDFEVELYTRYRHVNPETGRKWSSQLCYRLFHNPIVWGVSAYGYTHKEGLWVFDENEPTPAGVHYNRSPSPPIPPLYTGDLAEEIKAELRERKKRGGRIPFKEYTFSGLLACGECGRIMSVAAKPHAIYWRCNDPWRVDKRGCSNHRQIREDVAQGQINDFLERWLKTEDLSRLPSARRDPMTLAVKRIEQIHKELIAIERKINNLVQLQIDAEINLRVNYAQALTQLSERKTALQTERDKLQSTQESISVVASRLRAAREIKGMGLKNFWKQGAGIIQKTLAQVIGKARFIVLDGEIVDLRR